VGRGQAKQIFLVGFDGFNETDTRHMMMQDTLDQFAISFGSLPVTALTKSGYRVHQRSLFAPL
jgi:hypothetical protein